MVTKLIFTTVNQDTTTLSENLGFLGKSFAQMQSDFSNAKGFDKVKAAFSGIGKEVQNTIVLLDEVNVATIIDEFNGLSTEVEKLDFISRQTDEGVKSYLGTLKTGQATTAGYTAATKTAAAGNQAMSLSAKAASVSIGILRVAMNIFVSMLIISAISSFVQWLSTLKTQSELAAEAIKNQIEKIKTLNDEISKLDSELNNLKGIEDRTKAQENYIRVLEEELRIKRELEKQEQKKLYEQKYGKHEEYNYANGSWLTDAMGYTDPNTTAKITVDPIDQLTHSIKIYQDTLNQLETAETTEDIERLSWAVAQQEKSFAETYRELYNFKEAMGYLPPEAEALMEALYRVIDKQSAFSQALENDQSLKYYAEQLKGLSDIDLKAINFDDTEISKGEVVFKALVDAANEYGLSVESLISILVKLGYVQGDVINSATTIPIIDTTTKAFENLNSSIDSIQSVYKTLSSAIEEYQKNGYLSLDTTQSIIALGDEYIGMLFDENGQLQLNAESFIQLANAKLDELEATALRNAINNIAALVSEKKATDDATTASQNAAVAKAEETEETLKLAEAEMLLAAAKEEAMGEGVAEDAINRIIDTFNQYKSVIDATRLSLGNYQTSLGGVTSATKSAADAQKEYEAALKTAQSAINDLLSMTISMLKQQYTDQKSALQDILSALTERYNAEREEIQKTYNETKKALDKEKKDLQRVNKERKKAYDEAKKAEKELYDEAKKRHDAEKKALQDELDLYRKRIKEQIDALTKQENQRDYEKGLSERQKNVSDLEAQLLALQFDTSESGTKKRRELEEKLAKAREELEEYQYKHSIDLQKEALEKALQDFEDYQQGKLDALDEQWEREKEEHERRLAEFEEEYEKWKEYYDQRLEDINDESERLSEEHQAELERIEERYKRRKASLDQQIKDIEKAASDEVAIRNEAIRLIEEKSEEFKNNLLKWNLEYGDHTKATFDKVWNDAYAVLGAYNNQQINVRNTLETLVAKMNSFAGEINKAVEAMERLAKASQNIQSPSSGGSGGKNNASQYHDGGIAGESLAQRHTGKLKPNEVFAVLEKGEPVLSNKHSASDIQNAIAYLEDAFPANDTRAILASFVNDAASIQDMISIPLSASLSSSAINSMLSSSLRLSPVIQNLERIPLGGDSYEIDHSITVQGNVDKDVWPGMKKTLEAAYRYTGEQIRKRDVALNRLNFGKLY